jgi:hypothetical protein
VPDSDGEIRGKEIQQPRDPESEGKDSTSGNSLQHQDDISTLLTTLHGPRNAVSIIEDDGTQSCNRIASPRLSLSHAGSRTHGDTCPPAVFDCDGAMLCQGDRRPHNSKRKGTPPTPSKYLTRKKRKHQLRRSTRCQGSERSHDGDPTCKMDRNTKGQLPSPAPSASHALDTKMWQRRIRHRLRRRLRPCTQRKNELLSILVSLPDTNYPTQQKTIVRRTVLARQRVETRLKRSKTQLYTRSPFLALPY